MGEKSIIVAEWIKFSDRDFDTAKYLHINMHPAPLEIICYQCQQAAEKALKAFLIYSNVKPEKTHDLEYLCKKCMIINSDFDGLIENCENLNDYGSQPRYPFELEIIESDALLALQDSEKICKFVKNKLQ